MNVLQSMFISGKALDRNFESKICQCALNFLNSKCLLVARCLYSKTKTGQALFGHEKSVVLNV